ncbi:MAG: DM13 domain-containing protein [Microscillaceae bacterium]|jgi:hypothetical protein|nr:DM13 domain-containing protein [Microscillaceae bacterium]
MKRISILFLLLASIIACRKITPPPPPVLIPKRIEISPDNQAVTIGESVSFTAKMYDNLGNLAMPQPVFVWSVSDNTVAEINPEGVVLAKKIGQINIKAQYQNIQATALLNVIENPNQIALIRINPEMPELTIHQTLNLTAMAFNGQNQALEGKNFTWQSDQPEIMAVNSMGVLTAKKAGTALITASAEGIQSSIVMAAVVKKGNFVGKTGHQAGGTAKLKIVNNNLQLIFENNFSACCGPDFRVYLSNQFQDRDISGGYELAILQKGSGSQTYQVPNTIGIDQYRYAIIWCKKFNVLIGVAELN